MPGPCPTAEQLAAALRGTQSSADEERLGAHLSDCPDCRTRLEAMAGGSVWLQARAGKRAGTTPGTSDLPDPSQRSPLLERAMENLQRPSEPSTPPNADPLLEPGTVLHQFGDYEVLEELGRGGMGVVFKARQRSLNRLVALKLILAGQLASETEVRRFRNEAEAAARLDHPGILPVYEIGEHEGRHYFTMKLVEGQPLSSRLAGLRSTKSYREMAGLVAQMARAVHFAHQHGILHRDLKPSNILLDAGDQPYLMDFGLAKILESDSNLTLSVAVMGTPNYMAPEVASGQARQVTTAVDVFSLGAILYELLTGRPPFQGATSTQTLRLVLEKDPASPVALNPAVPNDLATICLKCLEKEPARRYASAELLAQDLELFCHGEPITARPLTAVEQFGRWYRRNKLVFTAASAVVSALVIGLGASTRMFFRERAARTRADEQMAIARELNQFLQNDLLRQASSLSQAEAHFTPEANLTVREALERAAGRIGDRFQDQPLEEAAVRMTLGDALIGVGEFAQAVTNLQQALELRRTRLGPNHPDTLSSMDELANAYHLTGKLDKALPLFQQTVALRKAILGPDNPDTLKSMNRLGVVYLQGSSLDQARLLFEAALKRSATALGPNDQVTLRSLNNLAWAFDVGGEHGKALPLRMELLQRLKTHYTTNHPDTLLTMDNVALDYLNTGRLDEALPLFKEALTLQEETLGPDHPETLRTMGNLAAGYAHAGKFDQALPLAEKALERLSATLGTNNPMTLTAMFHLADVYRQAGQRDRALPLFRQTLKLQEATLGPGHIHTLATRNDLALLYVKPGMFDQALPLLEENLKLRIATLGPDQRDTRSAIYNLAYACRKAGKLAELETQLRERLAEVRQLYPEDRSKWGGLVDGLMNALLLQRKLAEAEQVLNDVLTAPILNQPASAAFLRSRGNLRARRGEWKEAAADFRRAIALHPNSADSCFRLAPMLVKEGDLAGYREHCRRSLERFATTTDPLTADMIAKDCLILASAGVNLETVGRMEDLAVTAVTNYSFGCWFEVDKGLAQYRLGNFAAALEWVRRGMEDAKTNWNCQVFGRAVRAMAQYKMKQTKQAGITLANALETAEARLPKIESEDLGDGWIDVVISRALLGEASTLIEAPLETKAAAK